MSHKEAQKAQKRATNMFVPFVPFCGFFCSEVKDADEF
jgi:hypothetical protein